MTHVSESAPEIVARHRAIWDRRPELRDVYRAWYESVAEHVGRRRPIVEIGAGPGFFKAYRPDVIATDVIPVSGLDVRCDAVHLPFRASGIGAIVLIDVLHHLARPLELLDEAVRTLRPGGRVVMLEPWMSPLSYLIYRFAHHEDCDLGVDPTLAFNGSKDAFDGNAAIPYVVARRAERDAGALRLARIERLPCLDYLMTMGFRRTRPVAPPLVAAGRVLSELARPVARAVAMRALLVWEKEELP